MTSATDPLTGETINPKELYQPGIGTRILRAVLPGKNPATRIPINAPNSNYRAAEAQRQAQAGAIESQEQRNIANEKADSERLRGIGTLQKDVATGYKDVAGAATGQQTAEQKAEYNQEVASLRQQLADQKGVPTTYEQAEIAARIDPDPVKRAQYAAAAKTMRETEIKKFQYKNDAMGVSDARRQPLIDDATAQVQELNDKYDYDPDANRFFEVSNPSHLVSPSEFTDMKNKIATTLDKTLAQKKMPVLGVRFNIATTTPSRTTAPAQQPTRPAAAPAQTAPRSAAEVQQGQVYNGNQYLGGDRNNPASWKWVGQGSDPFKAKRGK